MLIHRILTMNRRDKPKARTRRSVAQSRFQFETLEDRTALSALLSAPSLQPPVHSAVQSEFVLIASDAPLVYESAAFASGILAPTPLPVIASSSSDAPPVAPSSSATETILLPSSVGESLAKAALSAGPVTTSMPLEFTDTSLAAVSAALLPMPNPSGGIAEAGTIERPLTTESTATSGDPAIPYGDDLRFANPADPMSPEFIPTNIFGLNVLRGAAAASNDNTETDESFSGPVPWTETDTGNLTWMSLTQASGRASGRGSSPSLADVALQTNPTGEVASASALSYLASGGSKTLQAELFAPRDEQVIPIDQAVTDSDAAGPILDAGFPLNILLSGASVPIPLEQGSVEQVAELIPLSQTSLALAATLWTVRSDSQASAPGSDPPAAATSPVVSFPVPADWAVFMTGIDRLFVQTFRDVQVDAFGGDDRRADSEESQSDLDDSLRWQGPILPGTGLDPQGSSRRSFRPGQFSGDDESSGSDPQAQRPVAITGVSDNVQRNESSGIEADTQAGEDKGQSVVLASTPVLWVLSVSSIVAGWFWGKTSERRQRAGPEPNKRGLNRPRPIRRACGSLP